MKRIIYAIGETHDENLKCIALEHSLMQKADGENVNLDDYLKPIGDAKEAWLIKLHKLIAKKGIKRIFTESDRKDAVEEYHLDAHSGHVHCLNYGYKGRKKFEIMMFAAAVAGSKTLCEKLLSKDNPKREAYWADRINRHYGCPSLIICGDGHLDPDSGLNGGNLPRLLKSLDYEFKVVN